MNHCLNLYILMTYFCLSWINPFLFSLFCFLFSILFYLLLFLCVDHTYSSTPFWVNTFACCPKKILLVLFIHFGFLFFCVRSSNFVNSTSNCTYMLMNMYSRQQKFMNFLSRPQKCSNR